MKFNNLPEISATPLIIQGLVACTWTHFTNTGPQCIRLRPSCFHLLPTGSANTVHITETKGLAVLAVPIDIPTWDSDFEKDCRIRLHVVCQLFNVTLEVLEPLTTNIVRYHNVREFYTGQHRKNDIVHVAVPILPHFPPIEF